MLEFFKEIVQSNPALATMYSGGIVAMFVMHSKVIFGWVYTKLISLISFSISYNAKIYNYESVPNKNLELLIKNQTHLFQNTYEINNKQEIGEGYGVTWLWMFKKLVYFSKSWESDANGVTLKIFLRVYFANKKKFVTITYRRKEGDGYKRITLEIIPEDENSQNTYEGFLYVKE